MTHIKVCNTHTIFQISTNSTCTCVNKSPTKRGQNTTYNMCVSMRKLQHNLPWHTNPTKHHNKTPTSTAIGHEVPSYSQQKKQQLNTRVRHLRRQQVRPRVAPHISYNIHNLKTQMHIPITSPMTMFYIHKPSINMHIQFTNLTGQQKQNKNTKRQFITAHQHHKVMR